MRIEGIFTKTISIELASNVYSYSFATQDKYLGMPRDATILSIWVRTPRLYPNDKDVKGRTLSYITSQYGNITLKDTNGDAILQNIPLAVLDTTNLVPFQQTYFQPIKNYCVDWLGSTVQIATSPGAPTPVENKEVIEFTIHYTLDLNYNFKKSLQEQQSNLNLYGVRSGLLSVKTTINNPAQYELSTNSSIGLPDEATIVGYSPIELPIYDPLNRPLVNNNVEVASFLTLQFGQRLILDAVPLQHLWMPFLGIPYFPLPPMPIEEIDWESSKFYCSSPAAIKDNEAYMLMLYYVCKDKE